MHIAAAEGSPRLPPQTHFATLRPAADRELAMMQMLAKAIAACALTIWFLLLGATTAVLASVQIAGAEEV